MEFPSIIKNLSDNETVGLTIIGEGRGEPIEGQVAIGSTIRNRLYMNPNKYKSFKDVCLEPRQFSCWNEDDPNYPLMLELASQLIAGLVIKDIYLKQCLFIANGIISWDIVDNTQSSVYYLTTELIKYNKIPIWANVRKNEIIKGNQTFFNI